MPKHQPTIIPLTRPLNLKDTLSSGQCFSWQPDEAAGTWTGWLAGKPCTLSMTTDEPAGHLCRLPGIGPKIAHCILLYGCQRLDAFPIDVWMSRILRHLYFPHHKTSPSAETLLRFARDHFGPSCGLAQLHLFHAFRTGILTWHTA